MGRGKGGGDVSISGAERKPHTGVGDHRGLVLGISPPPPEHIEEPWMMIMTLKMMKMTQMITMILASYKRSYK